MMHARRWSPAVVLTAGLVSTVSVHAAQPSLAWDEAFPTAKAAAHVHAEARFQGTDGAEHRLELWRHGSSFLRRRTDETLDLYVSRPDGKADYTYRLVDHRRRVSMDVRRNQLYRIGVFSDWFGLAHIIDRPQTRFTVRAVSVPPQDRRSDCTWRALVRGSQGAADESRVCWSAVWGIPLAIRTRDAKGGWRDQFTVERIEAISATTEGPALPSAPEGYASFDAGNEIDPKAGD